MNLHLHYWCNGFTTHAMDVVNSLIKSNKDVFDLMTKENIAELVNAYLDSKEIWAGSEHKMFAYYYHNWNNGVNSKVCH